METIYIILYIAAAICFILAVPWSYYSDSRTGWAGARVNLVALGLFFWVLVPLITAIKAY